MKRMTVKMQVLAVLMLSLCFGSSLSVRAAKVSKETYRSLYRPIVENGYYYLYKNGSKAATGSRRRTVSYFYLLDINRDGIKELICEPSDEREYGLRMVSVFTIASKRAVYCGDVSWYDGYPHKYGCFSYSKKNKALYCFDTSKIYGGGVMGQEKTLYRLSGKKLMSYRFWKKWGMSTYTYMTGATSAKAKKVSKQKASSYVKKYFKNAKSYTMYPNTTANLADVFG